jgi:hypothetical protein
MITDDYNFEILPSEAAANGVLFGIGQHVSLDDAGFVPGSSDWITQDGESPQTGITEFGRDRLLGPSWSWQLHVNRNDAVEARATLGVFRAAWHALHVRNTPGAVIPIRYKLEGDEVRRIYGRPRRFEAPPDNRILGGYVPVSCDFKCVDGFTYSDTMTQVTLSIGTAYEDPAADTGGGFIFPVTFPAITLPPTKRQQQLAVGGDAPAYPIIRFNGPVIDPGLETDDWRIQLRTTIPIGQYIEIDTRPWKNTVLLNGNAGVGGLMGRRTRLSQVVFQPGKFDAKFIGSSSGTATCEVRWASTWNSI